MFISYRLVRSLAVAGAVAGLIALLTPPAVQAQDSSTNDGFDNIDKLLDTDFQNTDQKLDAAFARIEEIVNRSFNEAQALVEGSWGKDASKMPEQKSWTGYSENLKTRVLVDYEAGTITVESQEDMSVEELQAYLDQVLDLGSGQLDGFDIVQKKINENVIKEGFEGIAVSHDLDIEKELADLVDLDLEPVFSSGTIQKAGRPQKVGRITVSMKHDHEKLSAKRLEKPVMAYADFFSLKRQLVFAIIHNESAFNPRARSNVPAFGLMQLVPTSGGLDAWRFLKKGNNPPTPDYLYQPVENVEMGAAYLSILYSKYLKAIKNPISRLYCTIAAYNTGAGNVAKAFGTGTSVSRAATIINTMQPEDVYNQLIAKLPYEETQNYLKRVRNSMRKYANYDY